DIVLGVFGVEGEVQVHFPNSFLLLGGDRTLDCDRFRALNNRGDNCAADEIAPVKNFFAATAERDFEKFIFFAAGKLPIDEALDQFTNRRSDVLRFLGERAVVGQVGREVDAV